MALKGGGAIGTQTEEQLVNPTELRQALTDLILQDPVLVRPAGQEVAVLSARPFSEEGVLTNNVVLSGRC